MITLAVVWLVKYSFNNGTQSLEQDCTLSKTRVFKIEHTLPRLSFMYPCVYAELIA